MGTTTFVNTISPRYAAALAASIQPRAVLAEVWNGDTKLATFQPDPGCSVHVDRGNVQRRIANVALAGGVLADGVTPVVPKSAYDIFTPVGHELRLYRGIAYADGTGDVELVCQGVFGMESVVIDDSGADLVVACSGNDRTLALSRAGFLDTYTIPPGSNVVAALQAMVAFHNPGFEHRFNFPALPYVTPNAPIVYTDSDDVVGKAIELANSIGCEFFADRNGVWTLLPTPDPTSAPIAWTYAEGATNLAEEVQATYARSGAPNYIIRVAQGTGIATPLRAIAADTNPGSATRTDGPYGVQKDRQTTSLASTQAQLQAIADADLRRSIGALETLDVKALVKPDHDVDDVISVSRARAGLANARFVLDSFTIDFGQTDILEIHQARAVAAAV